jgi:hypothetical protein
MKDSATKACVGMACVTAVYAVYMTANAISGNPTPDGIVLTGIVATVAGLGGYSVAVARVTEKAAKPS